jgi:hypothetical protein
MGNRLPNPLLIDYNIWKALKESLVVYKLKVNKNKPKARGNKWYFIGGAFMAVCLLALGVWLVLANQQPVSAEAPEAGKILAIQASMPFQVLIPAYLPKSFVRAEVVTQIDQAGPSGEPMVELTYRTRNGESLFIRQWVPQNPQSEILAKSRPIETKWGQGWLLAQSTSLTVIWVDIGPLRISIFTSNTEILTQQQLLGIAESLGPASNQQVFTFVVEQPQIKEVAPAPPYIVPVNDQGIQEVTLVVTPGGYSPLRFLVRKGVPVRLIFKQLGQVGCGNELYFPADPNNPSSLKLEKPTDTKVLEFTPQTAGQFEFHCSHQMYRGIFIVQD